MGKIEQSLKYIFSTPENKNRILVIFAILFVLSIVSSIVQLFVQLPADFITEVGNNSDARGVVQAFAALVSFGVSIVLLPLSMYVYGYILKVTMEIRNGAETLPAHNDIWDKIKLGGKYFAIQFIYFLPVVIFFVIGAFLVSSINFGTGQDTNIQAVELIAELIIFFIAAIYIFVLLPLLTSSAIYNMLKTGKFSSIFDLSTIFNNIMINTGQYFYLYGVQVLAGLSQILAILTICLIFVVQPALQAISLTAVAVIMGNVFKEFDNKNNNGN